MDCRGSLAPRGIFEVMEWARNALNRFGLDRASVIELTGSKAPAVVESPAPTPAQYENCARSVEVHRDVEEWRQIVVARAAGGDSAAELAAFVGVSRECISKILRGGGLNAGPGRPKRKASG